MNDTIIDLRKLPQWLFIGYATDNAARPQVFDFSSWVEEYGSGTLELNLQRPGDEVPYPVTLSIESTTAIWTPSVEDTKAKGQGMAQFVYTVGGTVAHTAILRVLIGGSLGAGEDAPNGFENWFQKMQVLAAAAADSADASAASADSAEESAETAAEILEDVGTAGAEQIQAIEDAGTDQITAVGEAGAAQVQAVEEKGEEVLESIPEDYSELSSDVVDLKSSFTNRTAGVVDVVDGVGDLDVADPEGNVILRLADGEIVTKKFDSSALKTMDEDGGEADLDISDIYGNVLARFKGGVFETKGFRGFQYVTFRSTPTVYAGMLPFTLTINRTFRKGDHVVLHVERGAKPWDYGAIVNYYIGSTKVLNEGRGDNAWLECVVPEDVDSISAVYTGTVSTAELNNGDTFTLEVSLLGDVPVSPTVVTIKQDGSGDYATLRGALDAIGTQSNDVLNPYRIEIYPGTYDVLADYTDAEIAAAEYTATGFVGPKLLNGMHLVGMGNTPGETVLTAELNPDDWSDTIRGAISTLNCQGSCGFENLTIEATHLRYCCHDDFTQPCVQRQKRLIRNVVFRGYDVAYTPCTTYGAGTRFSTGEYYFENCDFGENGGLHTSSSLLKPVKVHLVNCTGHGFRIGDNVESAVPGDESEYRFDNCDFLWINQRLAGDVPHVVVRGSGGNSPLYQFDARTLYATGDVVIVPNDAKGYTDDGAGTVLKWYCNSEHGPRFRPAESADAARGIIVWEDASDTYIQTRGFVRTDRTGITTFNLGDYVGVSNGVAAVVSDASQAFGRIAYIDNTGGGYIKLNWRA